MKNKTRHKGKMQGITRLQNTKDGGPRFQMKIDGWTCRTVPDAMYSYGIDHSWEGKEVEAIIGTHYGLAMIDTIRKI